MFRSHIFVSICLLLTSLCSLAQAEIIHSQWGEALPLTTLKQAESASVHAILNAKAKQYIGVSLSAKRQVAFEKYLAMQARAFVSSIKELETTPYPDGTNNTIFDIQINTLALHQLIRELGVIYTSRAKVSYTLILQRPKATEEQKASDIEKITELELITGLTRKANMPVQLELRYKAPLWYATITPEQIAYPRPKPTTPALPAPPETNSPESPAPPVAPVAQTLMPTTITAEAPSLDSVWRSVWGNYLRKQQQIAAQTAEIYLLRVWGWKNSSAIEQLHQKLQTWEASIQNPVLATIDMQHGTTSATWQMHVMHHNDLLQRLKKYTDQHGVSFSLDTISAVGTQSGAQFDNQATRNVPLQATMPVNTGETAPASTPLSTKPASTGETAPTEPTAPQELNTVLPVVVPTTEPAEIPPQNDLSTPNETSIEDTNQLPPEPKKRRKWYEAPEPKPQTDSTTP